MFRTKTRGQVIGAELQEGFSHLGTAVTEAGRAAAEQLAPRLEAARGAAVPALEAAQKAVAPKVAAAVAVAAPAVASARETLGPRFDAAREAAAPALEAAQKAVDAGLLAAVDAITPRVEAARGAAGPAVSSAVAAATAAAAKAAADLAPRMEAAQKAAQKAIATDVVPKVVAARAAVAPAIETARGTLAAGVETARSELEARRADLLGSTAKARKQVATKGRRLDRKARRAAAKRAVIEPAPRRWPWLVAVLAVVGAAGVLLRRTKEDPWTPAPTGDGPVPSYREDPVPSSPSSDDAGKTVSVAQGTPGDATPPDSDLGWRSDEDQPTAATDSPTDPALDTATAAPGDAPQTADTATGSPTDPEEGAPGAGSPRG